MLVEVMESVTQKIPNNTKENFLKVEDATIGRLTESMPLIQNTFLNY